VQTVSSGPAEAITITYAPSGIVLPGFSRNGMTADESSSGGWLVVWTTAAGTFATRFAELDRAVLEPSVISLGGGIARARASVAMVEDEMGVPRPVPRLVYHDANAEEFRAIPICGGAP
jgi:hypothetical protein